MSTMTWLKHGQRLLPTTTTSYVFVAVAYTIHSPRIDAGFLGIWGLFALLAAATIALGELPVSGTRSDP